MPPHPALFSVFETGSYYVALSGLEFAVSLSQPSPTPYAGITGAGHYAWKQQVASSQTSGDHLSSCRFAMHVLPFSWIVFGKMTLVIFLNNFQRHILLGEVSKGGFRKSPQQP